MSAVAAVAVVAYAIIGDRIAGSIFAACPSFERESLSVRLLSYLGFAAFWPAFWLVRVISRLKRAR